MHLVPTILAIALRIEHHTAEMILEGLRGCKIGKAVEAPFNVQGPFGCPHVMRHRLDDSGAGRHAGVFKQFTDGIDKLLQ